jgi:hypothetical protein
VIFDKSFILRICYAIRNPYKARLRQVGIQAATIQYSISTRANVARVNCLSLASRSGLHFQQCCPQFRAFSARSNSGMRLPLLSTCTYKSYMPQRAIFLGRQSPTCQCTILLCSTLNSRSLHFHSLFPRADAIYKSNKMKV